MVRWFSFAAFIALLAVGWVLFELTNVWPFNADQIPILRTLFVGFALLATGAFLFGRWRLLPAALTIGAFATTSALSNARANFQYIASAGLIVLIVGLLTLSFGIPLNGRRPPNAEETSDALELD